MPGNVPRIVRELMQADVVTVSPETNLADLERQFASTQIGAMPVVDRNRNIVGLVSRFDLMRRLSVEQTLAELADSEFDQTLGVRDEDNSISAIGAAVGQRLSQLHARDIMVADVTTIGPDATLTEAARIMTERRFHRLPVVENGKLIGIVSAFDFMRLYASTPD